MPFLKFPLVGGTYDGHDVPFCGVSGLFAIELESGIWGGTPRTPCRFIECKGCLLFVYFWCGSAARDAEALEREIAMLSERYGEAAAAAKTTGKALREKEALLDACTAQVSQRSTLPGHACDHDCCLLSATLE